MKSGSLNLLEPSWPVKAYNGIALPLYMDLRLATLKAIYFYLLHNVSTLNQNAKRYPVSQFCVNTLPATKVTLITDGI
jgi:hypothetical protein